MTLDLEYLHHFTGSENWYCHLLNPTVLYTDGTKHVADVAGAYWLLDEIALAQCYESTVRAEEFQVWKLDVKDSAATLTCEDGNENVVYTKAIPFTDFPEPGITMWCANNTILLPTEY
jgi:hypothetical protein